MFTDEWLRLNGVWLHFQGWRDGAAGNSAGAETVLLHGLTQQSVMFDTTVSRLSHGGADAAGNRLNGSPDARDDKMPPVCSPTR